MQLHRKHYLLASLAIVAVEVMIALYVHDTLLRPYGGDALAVVLLYTLIRTARPRPDASALLPALACAYLVEVAQYFQVVARLGLTASPIASTVIGTSFDWRDFLAYTLGAASILLGRRLLPALARARRVQRTS